MRHQEMPRTAGVLVMAVGFGGTAPPHSTTYFEVPLLHGDTGVDWCGFKIFVSYPDLGPCLQHLNHTSYLAIRLLLHGAKFN